MEMLGRFSAHVADHPCLPESWKTPPTPGKPFAFEPVTEPSAIKLTDIVSAAKWELTGLYNEFYREIGVKYQMGIWPAADMRIVVSVNRGYRDFTEDERTLLTLLRPHIVQAMAQAHAFDSVRAQIRAMEDALESVALLELDPSGKVVFITQTARAWLDEFFPGRRDSNLPPEIQRWASKMQRRELAPPPSFQRHTARLTISCQTASAHDNHASGKLRLLLTRTEELASVKQLGALGITPREAEVLFWMTQGKPRGEIAQILSISLSTVNRHAEHIYSKLGVETATAAVSIATSALAGGQV